MNYLWTCGGVLENLVLEIKISSDSEKFVHPIASSNYGTIKNLIYKITESKKLLNYDIYLLVGSNYGTVENFIIDFEQPLYVNTGGAAVYANSGIIKNGYIYGKNIKVISASDNYVAGVARTNGNNGSIENVFSLVGIDSINNTNKGNICVTNGGNATVQNVYSVAIGESTRTDRRTKYIQ